MATKKTAVPTEALDALGRVLSVDSAVAFPRNNSMVIGKISAIHPKQVRVHSLSKRYKSSDGYLLYPMHCVLIDEEAVTMWLLTNG